MVQGPSAIGSGGSRRILPRVLQARLVELEDRTNLKESRSLAHRGLKARVVAPLLGARSAQDKAYRRGDIVQHLWSHHLPSSCLQLYYRLRKRFRRTNEAAVRVLQPTTNISDVRGSALVQVAVDPENTLKDVIGHVVARDVFLRKEQSMMTGATRRCRGSENLKQIPRELA